MSDEIRYRVDGTPVTKRSPTNSSVWKKKRAQVIKEETHCHICLKEVDKSLKFPDPMSATVDHIIPSSRGGSDDRSNLALAHNLCNQKRSTKPLDSVKAVPAPSQKWF